jgi:hypothetical protein
VESKIDRMKQEWDKFYRPYSMNMDILKKKYSSENLDVNHVTSDILNFVRGSAQLQNNHFVSFLIKELANTKILQRLDENCQIIIQNIEDLILERVNPVMDHILTQI